LSDNIKKLPLTLVIVYREFIGHFAYWPLDTIEAISPVVKIFHCPKRRRTGFCIVKPKGSVASLAYVDKPHPKSYVELFEKLRIDIQTYRGRAYVRRQEKVYIVGVQLMPKEQLP